MQISIDGYAAGSRGEMDWMLNQWDEELKKYVYNLTRPVDCIILGRNMAEDFINTWQARSEDPKTSDSFAKKMVETSKVVFSKSLQTISGKHTEIARGNLVQEVNHLKSLKGRDIIVYGGISFVSSLINANLIDEYNLFINPVILGDGMTIFNGPDSRKLMNLVYSTTFDCGITVLCYIPKNNPAENSKEIHRTSDSIINH